MASGNRPGKGEGPEGMAADSPAAAAAATEADEAKASAHSGGGETASPPPSPALTSLERSAERRAAARAAGAGADAGAGEGAKAPAARPSPHSAGEPLEYAVLDALRDLPPGVARRLLRSLQRSARRVERTEKLVLDLQEQLKALTGPGRPSVAADPSSPAAAAAAAAPPRRPRAGSSHWGLAALGRPLAGLLAGACAAAAAAAAFGGLLDAAAPAAPAAPPGPAARAVAVAVGSRRGEPAPGTTRGEADERPGVAQNETGHADEKPEASARPKSPLEPMATESRIAGPTARAALEAAQEGEAAGRQGGVQSETGRAVEEQGVKPMGCSQDDQEQEMLRLNREREACASDARAVRADLAELRRRAQARASQEQPRPSAAGPPPRAAAVDVLARINTQQARIARLEAERRTLLGRKRACATCVEALGATGRCDEAARKPAGLSGGGMPGASA